MLTSVEVFEIVATRRLPSFALGRAPPRPPKTSRPATRGPHSPQLSSVARSLQSADFLSLSSSLPQPPQIRHCPLPARSDCPLRLPALLARRRRTGVVLRKWRTRFASSSRRGAERKWRKHKRSGWSDCPCLPRATSLYWRGYLLAGSACRLPRTPGKAFELAPPHSLSTNLPRYDRRVVR